MLPAWNWSSIEPSIFGTLFERSLDPAQRTQLGAHYTGRHDIERVVEPVVMTPLRRRWEAVRQEADALVQDAQSVPATSAHMSDAERRSIIRKSQNARRWLDAVTRGFQDELAAVRILDPACGSGNFLYIALDRLLDLEKDVLTYRANNGLPMGFPSVRPHQVMGLEINEYAQQLAQVAIWIGYLQWMIGNGFTGISEPVLDPLETIRLQDALMTEMDPVPALHLPGLHLPPSARWRGLQLARLSQVPVAHPCGHTAALVTRIVRPTILSGKDDPT